MDLYRSGDHYVVHADLPGVDPGSVDVSVDGGTLTIKAERTGRTEETVDWIASERFTGAYLRHLSLGDGVDADQISATYHNGVLTVSIPVAQKAQPRRIPISAPADQTVIEASSPQPEVRGGDPS
ncbi:MAG TPA: Hsp20/alpha crystallin family protein [Jatrophihabitantaceae bacterium]|nr:Hsp20/alpha crystallin family protein [Jatrophihabitantaceae bacterium]